MNQPDPEVDPSRHVLAARDHLRRPDGGARTEPIALDEQGARVRALAGQAAAAETDLDNDWRNGYVVMSRGRAVLIANLLSELAERVTPGQAYGPVAGDGAYAAAVTEVAAWLAGRRAATADDRD